MEYRQVGSSDLRVTVVAFGAWAIGGFMWGGTDDAAALAALQASLARGVTTIDTAPAYGFGHSEEIVGKAIAGRRDEVQLLTKFGLRWDIEEGSFSFESLDPEGRPVRIYRNGRKHRVIEECEQSLRRLGTDHIDLYQQHWPDPSTPVEETCEALVQLQEQGKIRAAGVCNYPVDLLAEARKHAPIVSDQVPYSMVNRGNEAELFPYCRAHEIGLIVYSPLQRGLLTGKVTPDRQFPATDHRSQNPYFTPANRQRIRDLLAKFQPVADAHEATLAQVAIAWTLRQPGITCALVGARNPGQVEENAKGGGLMLSEEEMTRLQSALEDFRLEL